MFDRGERFECFDFDGFKGLLKLDADYEASLEISKLQGEQVLNLRKEAEALARAIAAQERNVGLLRAENDRLYKKWEAENKARHEAENAPNVGSWLGWGTAGVLGVTTAVLLGVILIE